MAHSFVCGLVRDTICIIGVSHFCRSEQPRFGLMNGQISAHPFAELLREIFAANLSGALRLDQDRAKAVVYFESGNPIFAASNVRSLRLGEYLTKRELVSPAQLSTVGNSRADTALAEALCKEGILERKVIDGIFATLVTDVLKVVFLWSEGTWDYDERTQLAESVRVTIATRKLLLEGTRKMALKLVASRFPNQSEKISPVVLTGESDQLLPEEGFVLSRVDRPLPLHEVLTLSGLRELDALRMIYGLTLANYLQRENWPTVLGRISPAAMRAAPKDDPPPPTPTPAKKSEEEELTEFFERIDAATNYYEVLNISQTATIDDVKRGYYKLARSYHPDRFHSQSIHGRIEAAFARITQAYETLIDSANRNTYDARLAAQERSRQLGQSAPRAKQPVPAGDGADKVVTTGDVPPEQSRAEMNFKEGYAALKQGQANAAVPLLAAAAQALATEARYRAFYGQALAMQGKSNRLAEMELNAAVRLDPANASYRLMLANLYFELKFFKRSLAETERVLGLDPENSMALELKKKLESV